MAESCDYKLAADLVIDCDVKAVSGIKNSGVIVNYEDIDFENTTFDEDNPNIITSLVLNSGARAYRIYVPGKTPYTGTKKSMVAGTYRNKFNKDVSIVLFDNGPAVVNDIINQLANGTFVVILENKFGGSDKKNYFEVYGIEAGLTATALDDDKYSEDTDGGWLITLQEVNAPSAGIYYFNESLTATRAAIEALTAE